MKCPSPSDVMESVTMYVDGCSSKVMAAAMATNSLRFMARPSLSTIATRSTSLSNMMPRSAFSRFTADEMERMAS